jgi:hypothetical protein
MYFRIVGEITNVQGIAKGRGIRMLAELQAKYGKGSWRKMKGFAVVELTNGNQRRAEVHWYEAHGIGRKGFKIKRLLDED